MGQSYPTLIESMVAEPQPFLQIYSLTPVKPEFGAAPRGVSAQRTLKTLGERLAPAANPQPVILC